MHPHISHMVDSGLGLWFLHRLRSHCAPDAPPPIDQTIRMQSAEREAWARIEAAHGGSGTVAPLLFTATTAATQNLHCCSGNCCPATQGNDVNSDTMANISCNARSCAESCQHCLRKAMTARSINAPEAAAMPLASPGREALRTPWHNPLPPGKN